MVLPHDESGTGPPLVLLHAGVADRTMWSEHLAPLAAEGYRVIAMDLPGFGAAPVADLYAPWNDVLETMDALELERATIVGNSFGGAVALRVAVASPDRVEALVLISAPPITADPSPALRSAWEAEESALERGDVEGAVQAVVTAWTLPGADAALRDRVASMQRRAFEVQLGESGSEEADDPLEEEPGVLEELAVPVLVAVGELDMTDFHEAARELVHLLPGAVPATLEGAGHLAPLEQPETFRELLLGFLRGRDEQR